MYADPQFDGVAFAVKKDGSLWSAGDVPLNGVKNSRMLSFGKLTFKDTTLYSPDEMKLKSLKISAGSLSPRFHKNKSSYKVTLPAKTAKVKITAVKIDARSKVQMRVGTAKFKTMSAVTVSPGKGKSKIVQIKVIGKNGWEKTCTVKVTRKKK